MKIYWKLYFFIVFFIGHSSLSNAQKLTFEYLTVKDGLAQNTVQSIIKDKYGFMWFGTFNGLCRYDGYKFRTYQNIPGDSTSLANNRIYYIYKDKKGDLWISTFDSYICRYNYLTDNFTRYKKDQLPQWLRDSTTRLRNLDNLNRSSRQLKQWIGTYSLGPTKEHLVFQTRRNGRNSLDDNNVYCFYKDNSDMIWIGTSTGGINKADTRAKPFHNFSVDTKNESTSSSAVRAMEPDGKGGMWLGMVDTGLVYSDPGTGALKYFGKGPLSNTVRVIKKDSFGEIWIGYRKGLDRYDPAEGKFYNYFKSNIGPSSTENRFLSIAEDPADHAMWFGTFDRVIRYGRDTKKFVAQSLYPYFDHASAICLFFDSQKNLWIGTEYIGIIELKRNPVTHNFTDTVIFRADGKNPKLPSNSVYTITQDQTGYIWAGTVNGLVRIAPSTGAIKVYGKNEGLADQYISKIIPDQSGNIWLSQKKGLSKLVVKSGKISNYDMPEKLEGFQFVDCSGNTDTATGKMNFGGTEGYISFQPDEIHDNPYVPVIALTDLQVLNRSVNVGQSVNGHVILSAPFYLTKKITLTQDDRSFSIEFAALHFANPEKNQYAYMLEGVDRDWIYTDASRRFAAYSNLHEGKYTFKVKASNCDGLWNPEPVTLDITILPPLWRTWWAYACYFFMLCVIIAASYKLIMTRQRYHRDILVEKLKAEKAEALDELKSRFFTNISHEFKTPLTLIIDPLENLLAGKLPADQQHHYYEVMHRNSRRLLGLINQFLDLRKLEAGSLRLHVKKQELVSFLQNIIAAFELQAKKRSVTLIFETSLTSLNFSFDQDVVDKVLYNLISNAFKFAKSFVKVSLETNVENNGVVIQVIDDGPGFSSEFSEKIFEPFYQADPGDNNIGGTGIGLSLSRELLTLHRGFITATSKPGIKTCFSIILPELQAESAENQGYSEPFVADQHNPETIESFANGNSGSEDTMILIIEDNDDIRNYLKVNLSRSYVIIEATDGNAGFEMAAEVIPDLIISDVMMPGLNGMGLCQMIKSDGRTSHIPVVLLTALQSLEYQIEGYETGADAYITKPFSTALLLVRIQNLLQSRIKLRKLFDKSTGYNTHLITTNPTDQVFLDKITALIASNMAEETMHVEWIAEQMFLSRTQLYRKIKSLTDRSVHDFITTIRLKKAAEMLLENRYTVSEIALLVGYSDPTNFSRNFQKQFGQTPKKYGRPDNHN